MSETRDHGPLPGLLIVLTVVTGLVDSVSYLTLGHVFVANMTGNVIFLGFGIAGAGRIEATHSLLAIAAFAVGAACGGRLAAGDPPHRGLLLAAVTAAQAVLVAVAAVLAGTSGVTGTWQRFTLIALLGIAMGAQNAVVRRLAVPDLKTTVLTQTVTGLIADTSERAVRLRRVASVAAMLVGALIGGLLLRAFQPYSPLWTAAAALAVCAAVSLYAETRRPASEAWR